jgi:hypothetical protein
MEEKGDMWEGYVGQTMNVKGYRRKDEFERCTERGRCIG